MASVCKTVFTPETTPAGSQVAKVFPWWATAYQEVTDNNAILNKFVFRAPQGNKQAFANDKPWPVYIDEIRFWIEAEPGETGNWSIVDLMDQTCFKISTDLQRDIVSKWMPGTCFNTEMDRHIYGYAQDMVYTFPSLYYLPYGSQMSVELYSDFASMVGDYVQCALRGCDPYNETPNILLTTPVAVPNNPTGAGRLVLAFDDNRDRPIRNLWVRDFTITDINYNDQAEIWSLMQIKFNTPEGPLWTNDITTPLIALCDQVPCAPRASDLDRWAPVIHRPPSPYILRPGDAMTIECQVRYEPDASYLVDHRIWAHVRGWQLGEGI